jgi:hypothetical protein
MITGVSGSFIVYRDSESTYVRIYNEPTSGLTILGEPTPEEVVSEVCRDAAQAYCFSDCSDEEVVAIFANGRELEYAGWKPGMCYVFRDVKTKETIWEGHFPEWDH